LLPMESANAARREVSPYALIAIPDGIDHPKRVRR